MVVIIDLDINNDIYLFNKIDVGERLVLLFLKNDYIFDFLFIIFVMVSGLMFELVECKENLMVVYFKNVKEGLIVGKSEVGKVLEVENDKFFGFELVDEDGLWYFVDVFI